MVETHWHQLTQSSALFNGYSTSLTWKCTNEEMAVVDILLEQPTGSGATLVLLVPPPSPLFATRSSSLPLTL